MADGTGTGARPRTGSLRAVFAALARWFDTGVQAAEPANEAAGLSGIDWPRVIPFIGLHLACLAVFAVGVSPIALLVAAASYAVRMFAITGFYHRYFSHRAFRTSRPVQFAFALLGAASVQRGPLWWAAHHRHHHRHADTPADPHSPVVHGFWHSHVGWFLAPGAFRTDLSAVPDLARYPELRFLDRFDTLVPVGYAALLLGLGSLLGRVAPQLGTNGPQMLVWGFFVSTVVLFHATVTINSLAHQWGQRAYPTRDDSRNNFWLALLTFGEGWHNNHHWFPGSARQGHHWWQIDLTWYGLRAMAALGLIRDLKPVPPGLIRAPAPVPVPTDDASLRE